MDNLCAILLLNTKRRSVGFVNYIYGREDYKMNEKSKPRSVDQRSDDGFGLKILVKSVHSKISTKPAHLVASKWTAVVESKVTVDPNGTGSDRPRNGVGYVYVVGHYACCKPVLGVVCTLYSLLDRPAPQQSKKKKVNKTRQFKEGLLFLRV